MLEENIPFRIRNKKNLWRDEFICDKKLSNTSFLILQVTSFCQYDRRKFKPIIQRALLLKKYDRVILHMYIIMYDDPNFDYNH